MKDGWSRDNGGTAGGTGHREAEIGGGFRD